MRKSQEIIWNGDNSSRPLKRVGFLVAKIMKSNIEIVKDYLAGVRPVSVFGYTGNKYIKRKVGERWTDVSGIEWVQKNSGPQRVNRMADAVREAMGIDKCKKCKCEIRWGTRTDQILYRKTQLCTDCLIEYETKLRILGIYNYYEIMKLAANELSYLKDLKTKILETLKFFKEDNGDVTMVCNSEGFIERWKNTNREQIVQSAKEDLKIIRTRISVLNKIKLENQRKFKKEVRKYKLEYYV